MVQRMLEPKFGQQRPSNFWAREVRDPICKKNLKARLAFWAHGGPKKFEGTRWATVFESILTGASPTADHSLAEGGLEYSGPT